MQIKGIKVQFLLPERFRPMRSKYQAEITRAIIHRHLVRQSKVAKHLLIKYNTLVNIMVAIINRKLQMSFNMGMELMLIKLNQVLLNNL